ncbi:nucleotide-binding protein [Methanolapillus ohkumae]|uniref:Nucleotide-binding protein n=1 Tax=Methanolapillus ohkumae TaxID=3028298 RepID=A0AA96ZVR3_9EURY|nr:hypothetical protein MsAm2_07870 [Methanosarcinaceae archaeon Am2]
MKKENKIVIILFLTAFLSVLLLYVCVFDNNSENSGQIPVTPTINDVGKTVYVEGNILNKKMTFTGENLILNIEGKNQDMIVIFIPKKSGAAGIYQKIAVGDKIGVFGTVEEYNGTLEVVLKKEQDLTKRS